MKGLVIKSTGSWYQIKDSSNGKLFEARIRGKFKLLKSRLTNPLAVGDLVEYQLEKDSIAWITKIEPRRNYLIRKSVNLSKEAHIIASNLDLACVIFTLQQPETSLGFLDRFLACCTAYDITPLIIFNKIDLLNPQEIIQLERYKVFYGKIGVDCIFISAEKKINILELKEKIKDKVTLFFGHSGAGKSTLVNTLQPNLLLKTSEVSQSVLKGKHTTTFAQMYFWDFGGSVIDTPGVREFGMIDVKKEEIQSFFTEIFEKSNECKFYNCLHINEPKCAVKSSIEKGEIELSRYNTYLKLIEETDPEKYS